MKSDGLCHLPALGISSALSCRGVHARAVRRSHGWRRFGSARLVDRGTTPLLREFATDGVELEPLHVRRHYLSNHRVERTAASYRVCEAVGFSFASVSDGSPWSAAVSHSGRWAT